MASFFIVCFALLLTVAYPGRRRYLAEHVVFATRYVTFALLYLPTVLLVDRALADWLARQAGSRAAAVVASVVAATMLAGVYVYLALAGMGGILLYLAVTTVTALPL